MYVRFVIDKNHETIMKLNTYEITDKSYIIPYVIINNKNY